MNYDLLKQWLRLIALVAAWWIRRLGPKSFWGLMAASTLLAVFLNFKF